MSLEDPNAAPVNPERLECYWRFFPGTPSVGEKYAKKKVGGVQPEIQQESNGIIYEFLGVKMVKSLETNHLKYAV